MREKSDADLNENPIISSLLDMICENCENFLFSPHDRQCSGCDIKQPSNYKES